MIGGNISTCSLFSFSTVSGINSGLVLEGGLNLGHSLQHNSLELGNGESHLYDFVSLTLTVEVRAQLPTGNRLKFSENM